MENKESLLEEIEEFNKQGDESKPLSSSLESFIQHVAKSGTYVFPWQTIRKIYIRKLKSVLAQLPAAPLVPPVIADESNNSTTTSIHFAARLPQISYALSQKPVPTVTDLGPTIQIMKDRILERMESFYNAPFTIQRISELLVKPQIHYKRADKFLRGLEKCIMVVTTVDSEGKKIFIDNTITNGIAEEQHPLPLLLPPPVPPLLSDRTMTPPLLPPPIPSQNQQPPTTQTNSSVFSSFEYFTTVNYQSKSDGKEESVTEVTTTSTSSALLTRSLSIDMHEESSSETTRVSLKREQVLSAEEQAQEVIKRPRTKSNNDETPLQVDHKDEEVKKVNGGDEEESGNDDIDQPMENDENVQPVADSSGEQQQTPQDQEATN